MKLYIKNNNINYFLVISLFLLNNSSYADNHNIYETLEKFKMILKTLEKRFILNQF